MRIFYSDTENVPAGAAIHTISAASSGRIKIPLTHGDYVALYAAGTVIAHDAASATHLTLASGTDLVLALNFYDATDTWLDYLIFGSQHYDAVAALDINQGLNVVAASFETAFFSSDRKGYPNGAASFALTVSCQLHNDEAVAHSVDMFVRAIVSEMPGRIDAAV